MPNRESLSSKEIPVETERKFVLDRLPENIELYNSNFIRQGYMAVAEDGSEVRLRQRDDEYTQTVKSRGELSRVEIEEHISQQMFETFWPATEGKRLEKTRYMIPQGPAEIEIDVYSGSLEGLIVAEIEFPDELSAHRFTVPEWIGQEVTYDKRYKNQNLAIHGLVLDQNV